MKRDAVKGFSLLEVAIVMVIIGLIVGSVLAGQSMIRAAHMQTMLGEYDANIKAVNEFKDKFLALPGDMNNAESMWGSDPAGCPGVASTAPHAATCNGDGSGTIGSSDFSGNLSNSAEWFRAWQQLSDAGMVPSAYAGTKGAGGAQESVPLQNVPGSGLPGAGWTLLYYSQTTDSASLWGGSYGHVLMLGGFTAGAIARAPVLTASEASAIDQKIDDGNPGLGNIRAWRSALLPGCTTDAGTQTSQAYVPTTGAGYACSLLFLMGM